MLNRGQDFVLVNNGSGVFVNETAARFPVRADTSRGGGLADLDADGDPDLVVANSRNEPIALYINEGGVFEPEDFGATPGIDETNTGLELVDLDGNGTLDVYVPNAGAFTAGHGFGGGQDHYYRNTGKAKFTDRTGKHVRERSIRRLTPRSATSTATRISTWRRQLGGERRGASVHSPRPRGSG